VIGPISDTGHLTPEDWRILRALSFYRLLLVTLQIALYESGYLERIFDVFMPRWFYGTCLAYAIAALLLILPIVYRRPRVGVQAHVQFTVDVMAVTSMAYACGGVPSGLVMLVLMPAVGCSLVVTQRMAWVQAASATLLVFAEEVLRQYRIGFDTAPFTQTGILGLMFFATSIAANAVAMRARKSEALAERVGSDLASLAQLNQSVIEHMQTGVLVVEGGGRIRLLNNAAARLLDAEPGQAIDQAAPDLATAVQGWREGRPAGGSPLAPRPGAEEIVPRFTRLGAGESAPVLILLENARALREQAQQMKLAALGRLSASIAHEIRNPLAAISHAGQLLAESPEMNSGDQRLLSMIQRHSERIDKIVKDVLALSRRDAPAPAPIRLRAWLEQAVSQYREGYPGQMRPILFEQVAAGVSVRFDSAHLQQVLFNLWDNSFEHGAGANGRAVTVALASGRLHADSPPYLDIRDNGPGIAADLHELMFEPFFTTARSGTGLGLYLARELCEYNHARLSYRPQPDGACFRLVFAEANLP
jgi:two-component system sensor histidine kinase PilS (NtrC family)